MAVVGDRIPREELFIKSVNPPDKYPRDSVSRLDDLASPAPVPADIAIPDKIMQIQEHAKKLRAEADAMETDTIRHFEQQLFEAQHILRAFGVVYEVSKTT